MPNLWKAVPGLHRTHSGRQHTGPSALPKHSTFREPPSEWPLEPAECSLGNKCFSSHSVSLWGASGSHSEPGRVCEMSYQGRLRRFWSNMGYDCVPSGLYTYYQNRNLRAFAKGARVKYKHNLSGDNGFNRAVPIWIPKLQCIQLKFWSITSWIHNIWKETAEASNRCQPQTNKVWTPRTPHGRNTHLG